ncbi:MAG: PAS domain S-box protein [Cyanobacteria bacterium J06638_28]
MISDRALYERTPALLQAMDAQGIIIAVSDAWLAATGYQREEVEGQLWWRFLTVESQAIVASQLLANHPTVSNIQDLRLHLVKPNRTVIDVTFTGHFVASEPGQPAHCLGVLTEVIESPDEACNLAAQRSRLEQLVSERTAALTELNQRLQQEMHHRQQAEAALRQSERLYRTSFDYIPVGIVCTAADCHFMRFNQRFCQMLGYTEAELRERQVMGITHPDDQTVHVPHYEQLLAGEIQHFTVEKRYLKKDGSILWASTTITAARDEANQILFTLALIEDISDRKTAAITLQESERRLRLITETIQDHFWIDDAQACQSVYDSPSAETIWGVSASELKTGLQPLMERVHPDDRAAFRQSLTHQRHQTHPQEQEFKIITAEGETRWLYERTFPILDNQGQPYQVVGVTSDITQQKTILAALQQSEERLRLIADNIATGFWLMDGHTHRTIYVNPAFERIVGLAVETLNTIPKAFLEHIHPDDRDRVATLMQPDPSQGSQFSEEYRVCHPDGTVCWIHDRCTLVMQNDGEVRYRISVITDITERRQAEEALHEYQRIISATPDPVCLIGSDYIYRLTNTAFNAWLGKGQSLTGLSVADVVEADFFARVSRPRIDRALAGETQSFEEWAFNPTNPGEEFISITYAPYYEADGTISGVVNSIRNLTPLKKVRDRLMQTSERLRLHIENSPLGVIEWDMDLRVRHWSTRAAGIFGWSEPAVKARHLRELTLFLTEDVPTIEAHIHTLSCDPSRHQTILTRNRNKQGEIIYCEWHNSVLLDDAGNLVSILSLVQDVTERQQTQQALQQSEERWQLALHGSNEGIWDWQIDTNTVFFSARWKELLGYADHELPNRRETWISRVHPEDMPTVQAALEAHLCRETVNYEAEYRMRHKSGEYRWILARGKAVFDENGRPVRVVGSHRDTSNRKAMETELRDRLQFEQLLRRILTQLVDLPGKELATGILRALQEIASVLQVERGFVCLRSVDSSQVLLANEWYAPDLSPLPEAWSTVPIETFTEWFHHLMQRQVITLSDRTDCPPEAMLEKQVMASTGLRSLALVPMFYGQVMMGYVGLATETRIKIWIENESALLQLIGDVFANTYRRQQAEVAQRESDLRFQAFFEQSAVSMAQIAMDGTYIRVNPAFCHLVGRNAIDLIGTHYAEVTHPADLAHDVYLNNEVIQGQVTAHVIDKRFVRPDGEERYVQAVITAVSGSEDAMPFLACVHNDVTERVVAEKTLRNIAAGTAAVVGEDFFAALAEHLAQALNADHVLINELQHLTSQSSTTPVQVLQTLVFWSDGQLQSPHTYLVSNTPCELVLQDGYYICPSGVQAAFPSDADLTMLEAESYVGVAFYDTEGNVIGEICVILKQPLKAVDHTTAILRIFADRAAAELQRQRSDQALRESEARLQHLASNMPGVIYRYHRCSDGSDRFSYVSPGIRELWELEPEALYKDAAAAWNLVHPDDLPDFGTAIRHSIKYQTHLLCEFRLITPSGVQKWVQTIARPVPQAEGSHVWDGLVIDITARKHIEHALQTSEALNRAILEALPDLLLRVHRDGTCLDMQYPSHFKVLCPKENQIGRGISAILPAEVVQERMTAIEQAFVSGEMQIYEYEISVNGQLRWEEARVVPLADDEVLILVRDIEERKRAEEEVRRLYQALADQNQHLEELVEQRTAELLTFMNSLPDQVFVVERDTHRMPFGNAAVTRFAQIHHQQDLEGKTIFECYPPELATHYAAQNTHVFETGKVLHVEEAIATRQGTLYFDTYKIPLKRSNGEVYALIGSSRDVTEITKARQALEAQSAQLEATNQELQAFSYSISHDLRAPLRHINGFIVALQQRLSSTLERDSKVAHYLDVISNSSHRMGLLIDGLLILSRVGRRELAMRPVDLAALVDTTLSLLEVQIENSAAIDLTVDALPTVQGDSILLQQVLTNLLDNAIKFSRDRQPARIQIGQRPEDGAIFIRDNGVGFDMAYADKLFSPFQRLHRVEDFPGTGIGLAIVQRIIHRHQGHIWVQSMPEQGTTFFFTLPLQQNSES